MSRVKHSAKNITGQILCKIRDEMNLTQDDVARKCQLMGWDISRDTIMKIEGNRRLVADYELHLLAKSLNVNPERLLAKSPDLSPFMEKIS